MSDMKKLVANNVHSPAQPGCRTPKATTKTFTIAQEARNVLGVTNRISDRSRTFHSCGNFTRRDMVRGSTLDLSLKLSQKVNGAVRLFHTC